MRTIKFRFWNKITESMTSWEEMECGTNNRLREEFESIRLEGYISMQFTGLLDKNGLKEVYEGDIIDEYGKIKGNIYEMDKEETDLVIEGFGTASWAKTEMAGLGRGLTYAK